MGEKGARVEGRGQEEKGEGELVMDALCCDVRCWRDGEKEIHLEWSGRWRRRKRGKGASEAVAEPAWLYLAIMKKDIHKYLSLPFLLTLSHTP